MSQGPRYFDDGKPRCRWCENEIKPTDKLGMKTGYCSSDCFEHGCNAGEVADDE